MPKIIVKKRKYDGLYGAYARIPLVNKVPRWITIAVSRYKQLAARNGRKLLMEWLNANKDDKTRTSKGETEVRD